MATENFSAVHHRILMDTLEPSLSYGGDDLNPWQRKLRRKVRQLIGDMPEERVSLDVRTLWKRDHPLGSIEKIVYAAEPYADVPAYVCLPVGAQPPYTFFICLQGHSTGMHNSIAVTPRQSTFPETGTSAGA